MPRRPMPSPEKFCERCGIKLQRKRYNGVLEDLTTFKKRKFCSLHCANLRGIKSRSSTSQHRISRKFRKERCELCGSKPTVSSQLHVHHKDGNWKNHDIENLITLCVGCHLRGHNIKNRKCLYCDARSRKHGMCQKHFQRWKKYGDPFLTKVRKPGASSGFILTRISS